MKIGILTLPLHTNYGGILQAYALQTVLSNLGFDVYIIQKKNIYLSFPFWKAPIIIIKRLLKKLLGKQSIVFYEYKYNKTLPIIRQYTDVFIKKYLHQTFVNKYSDLSEYDFDAIIVGSDQVWRPKYFGKITHAFLDFTEGWKIKRIAYAASFGTDKWEYSNAETEKCRRLIQTFDAVSVREDSGVSLCAKYLRVNSSLVLDPTMLLSIDDYVNIINQANIPTSDGTLLTYILDDTPDKQVLLKNIAQEKKLKIFKVNAKVEDLSAPLNERIQPPVERWLKGFQDAKFIVTDSFHACVFSIIFNKPFLVFANVDRGFSRFLSLLKMFELEDRLIMGNSVSDASDEINWDRVNSILLQKKECAINFIKRSFKDCL